MQTWLYRASKTKAGSAETKAIITRFGFIHRGAHSRAAQPQLIANVGSVLIDDIIHLYYVGDTGKGQTFGVYRVADPTGHSQPALFSTAVPSTALYRVAPGALYDRLRTAQYEPDPQLGEYCGWPVLRVEGHSPPYTPALFPGRNSLVCFGDQDAPAST